MKYIFGLLICTLLLSCANPAQAGQTVIKGTLKGKNEATLYVSYVDDKGYRDETVEVKGGKFEWSKPLGFPTRVGFSLSKSPQRGSSDAATMWTEPGEMQLELRADDLSNYTLKGSSLDQTVREFEKQVEQDNRRIEELGAKMQSGQVTPEESAAMRTEAGEIFGRMTKTKMAFLEQHPESCYSASLLFSSMQNLDQEQLKHYLGLLSGDALDSPYARRIRQEIEGKTSGMAGSKAASFSSKDIDGKLFDLTSLIGEKYVILDFWASWCVPCRKSNPHLKELHNKYREDGLVVVCVADNDSSEDAWKKAVADDGIGQFIHVLRGWRGMEYFFDLTDASAKYGVHTLPTKFLIGKDGTILGRYGDGGEPHDAMDIKLKEVFGH